MNTTPASICGGTSSAKITYTEVDGDHDLDQHVGVLAGAAAFNAARELGLATPPPIRWFEPLSPALKSYRSRYLRGVALKTWEGDRHLLGIADVPRQGGSIWVRAGLRGNDLIQTVRHETFHHFEFATNTDYGEIYAELFAVGALETEPA